MEPDWYEYRGSLDGAMGLLKSGQALSIDNEAERLPLFIPKHGGSATRAEGTLKDIPDTHWGYIPKIYHPAAGLRSLSPDYDADSETIGLLFSWDQHWKTTGISGNQLPHPAASDFNDYLPLDMVIVLGPPTPSSAGTSDVKRPVLEIIDDWDDLQDELLANEASGISNEHPWWTPHLRGLVWRKLVQREINPESLRMIASRDLSRWIPQFFTTQWSAMLNWRNFPEGLL